MIVYILIQKNGFEAHVFERGKTSSTSNTNFVNSINFKKTMILNND